MHRLVRLLACAGLAASLAACGEESQTAEKAEKDPLTIGAEMKSEQDAKIVARELLEVTNASAMFDQINDTMTGAFLNSMPGISADQQKAIQDIVTSEIRAEVPVMFDQISEIYAKHFSPEELEDLIAFYKTPIGQKLLERTPRITQESIVVGQSAAERRAPAIRARIQALIEEAN